MAEASVVEDLVLIVETISHMSALLASNHQMLKPVKAEVNKKNKKGGNAVSMVRIIVHASLLD